MNEISAFFLTISVTLTIATIAGVILWFALLKGWKRCEGDDVQYNDGKCIPKPCAAGHVRDNDAICNAQGVPCVGYNVEISGSSCVPKPYDCTTQGCPVRDPGIGGAERFAVWKNHGNVRSALSYVKNGNNGEELEWRENCSQHSIDFYMHTAPYLFTSDGRDVCWDPEDSDDRRRRLVLGERDSGHSSNPYHPVEFTILHIPNTTHRYTIETKNPQGALNVPVNSDEHNINGEAILRAEVEIGPGFAPAFDKVQCPEGDCCPSYT